MPQPAWSKSGEAEQYQVLIRAMRFGCIKSRRRAPKLPPGNALNVGFCGQRADTPGCYLGAFEVRITAIGQNRTLSHQAECCHKQTCRNFGVLSPLLATMTERANGLVSSGIMYNYLLYPLLLASPCQLHSSSTQTSCAKKA